MSLKVSHSLHSVLIAGTISTLIGGASPVVASVSSVELAELTRDAVAIAVVKVERVRRVGEAEVAWATVLMPLKKLRAGERFTFLASKIWTCDVSEAVAGETALVFLEPAEPLPTKEPEAGPYLTYPHFEAQKAEELAGFPFYFLAHSGRGRIPAVTQADRLYLPVHQGYSLEREQPCLSFSGIELPEGIQEHRLRPFARAVVQSYVRLKDVLPFLHQYLSTSSDRTSMMKGNKAEAKQ